MSPVFRHGRLRLYLLKLLDEAEAAAKKNDIKAVQQVLAKFRKRLSGA